MQKWTALLLFALLVGSVGLLWFGTRRDAHATGADAGTDAAAVAVTDDAGLLEDGDTPQAAAELSDAGGTLPNGERPPALPGEAPRSVKFGAILVQYRGAQGAPASARSRDAAVDLAKQLATEAKQDFRAALAKGDNAKEGDNLGEMPRGVFEPGPEFVLFSLPKGGVSDPVDTPRGFLIFRRIE
jgi:hypothetical protein